MIRMTNGISVYLGMDNTLEENMTLVKKAAKTGIRRIFTSLHIPEADKNHLRDELQQLLHLANGEDMEVITDVSPLTMEILEIDSFSLEHFSRLGVKTLRLDFGFGLDEIAAMSRNDLGIRLQLNASTITEEFLNGLMKAGAKAEALEACHNFYPRENTGLEEGFLLKKNQHLHDNGIMVSAFIPSFNRPRSPIGAGLPTLELHRCTSFDFSLRHLLALGVDSVFVGDSLPSDGEIQLLGELDSEHGILLRPDLWTCKQNIIDLISRSYTTRLDEARDVIRTQESRQYIQEVDFSIRPEQCGVRNVGYITLDNENYGRYHGELQIVKKALPSDYRVNIVASLSNYEMHLLKYLKPGTRFKFLL